MTDWKFKLSTLIAENKAKLQTESLRQEQLRAQQKQEIQSLYEDLWKALKTLNKFTFENGAWLEISELDHTVTISKNLNNAIKILGKIYITQEKKFCYQFAETYKPAFSYENLEDFMLDFIKTLV